MRRGARFALLGAAGVPVAAWALLRLGFFTPLFNAFLARELAGRTSLVVQVADLRGDLFRSLSADGVVVLSPGRGAEPPLLSVGRLDLEYRPWPMRGPTGWRWSPVLLRLDGLKLSLSRGPGGAWNVAPLWKPGPAGQGKAAPAFLPPLLAEWDNATVVFSDEPRGFHGVLDQVRGRLDLSSPSRLSFALSGRTEGHSRRNLALQGDWDRTDGSWNSRLSLDRVALASYLNYFLPVQGLRFIAGSASLRVRLEGKGGGGLKASGRALLADGALKLPGVRLPLDRVGGELVFDRSSLRFQGARARFLGSDWSASGAILDPARPRYDLTVENPAVPLEALSRQVRGLALLDLSGTASVKATLKGLVQAPRVDAWVQAPWLGIAGFELESVSANAGLFGRRLDVRRLSGTLWGGELDGSAGLDLSPKGGLKADLNLYGGLLQLARWKGGRPLPLAGLVQAQLKASGALRSPDLDVGLTVDRLRLGFWELGNLTATAGLSPRGFQGDFATDQGLFSGHVTYAQGAFRDTHAALKGVDLASTVRALAAGAGPDEENPGPAREQALWTWLSGRLDGGLSAAFTVEGPLDGPTVWARPTLTRGRLRPWGRAALPDGRAGTPWLALGLEGSLGLRGGQVFWGRNAHPFQVLLGPRASGWEFSALGRYPWNEAGDPGALALSFDLNLGLLDSLGALGRTKGRLTGTLAAGGRARSPRLQGSVTVSDFSCEPARYLAPVKDGAALLLFHGRTLQLARLGFKAPGAVEASGLLDLSDGWDGLKGSVEIVTDARGLRLQNWASMGSGSLALTPLKLRLEGGDEPLQVSGRVLLSQARVVYAGGGAAPAGAEGGGPGVGAVLGRRPLSLDLSVGLGPNVWYEKLQSKTLDLGDPRQWFSDTLRSAAETLTQPDISLRLAPTQRDFRIRGTTPDLDLRGDLLIDRGRVTLVGNDFEISHDKGPALIRLEGRRADVSGTAEASLSYTRFNPVTQRPQQRTVEVLALITPMGASALEAAGLEKSFLNYQVHFDSDPPIIADDPDRQQTAVVNLVVLGDPVVDQGSGLDSGVLDTGSGIVSAGPAVDPGALAAAAGLGTLTTGLVRKELNALLGRFGFQGGDWLDVVRLSPRIRYLAVGTQPLQAPEAAAGPQPLASPSQSQYDTDWDWVIELGKSISEKLYTSLRVLTFGEASRESVILYSESSQAVQSYGLRAGLEYQLSPYRSVDLYGDFGCDDDLNPVPYSSTQSAPNPSYLVQWRDTSPTGNYGALLARRRRWDSLQETEP